MIKSIKYTILHIPFKPSVQVIFTRKQMQILFYCKCSFSLDHHHHISIYHRCGITNNTNASIIVAVSNKWANNMNWFSSFFVADLAMLQHLWIFYTGNDREKTIFSLFQFKASITYQISHVNEKGQSKFTCEKNTMHPFKV